MRKNLDFDIFRQFENAISEYTGAPYVVLTDCCTHALELCFRLKKPGKVTCRSHTYLSVPMMLHKLDVPFDFDDTAWEYEYQFSPSNIWDSARGFNEGMYRPGALQCVSFGHHKRLEIGHGGCILTDSKEDYQTLRMMSYDGRDLAISPWIEQKEFNIGYHYHMRLEDAARGLEMLSNKDLHSKESQLTTYPDCSTIKINRN